MKKKQNKKIFKLISGIIIIFAIIFSLFIILWFLKQKSVVTHISKDLKIAFQVQKDWYVSEKDWSIMISSYKTNIGDNSRPDNNQIKMFIDQYSGCHESVEENLKDPACGEGGPLVLQNKIISKIVVEKSASIFYKYTVQYPNGKQKSYYLLKDKNSNKILQISKEPNPSKFENEFNKIINSIKFL